MKSMKRALDGDAKNNKDADHVGPIDWLIVSPVKGEPYYFFFRRSQLGPKSSFLVIKKHVKEFKHGDLRWSFTFDRKDRWHQVRHLERMQPMHNPPTSLHEP